MRPVAVIAIALAAVACSGAPSGRSTAPPAERVRVGLVEWDITVSASQLAAGTVTIEVANAGTTAHDLRAQTSGTETATPTLPTGDTATISIEAEAGQEVLLWCSIPGHRAQGMERTVRVADRSPSDG